MKIYKLLLPITSISTLFGLTTPLTSCNKPEIKNLSIKTVNGDILPSEINVNDTIELAAYVDSGQKVNNATFSTETPDTIIKLVENKIIAVGEGQASVKCSAVGYNDVLYNFTVFDPASTVVTIKKADGTQLSGIGIDQTVDIAAFNNKGQKISGATFSTTTPESILKLEGNNIRGIGIGQATISCVVEGYDDATLNIAVAYDFTTCAWSIVTDLCEKLESGQITETGFCDNFLVIKKTALTQATSFDDFLGQERKVTINSLEHKTRVVGCQQDYLDEGKEESAAMTFQFINVICENDGFNISTYWDTNNSDNYWDSVLCNFLNNDEEDDDVTSVFEMIKDGGNDGLADKIKDVYRGVNVYNESLEEEIKYELKTNKTKIFCPTLANYISQKGMQRTDPSVIPENLCSYYFTEGEQYQYYKKEIVDTPIVMFHYGTYSFFPCLIFKDLHNNFISNWLSSPRLNEHADCWEDDTALSEQTGGFEPGALIHAVCRIDGHGVAPCFCI